ncbi:glycosyltransferase family 4 protein [Gammaproteobacteria bacterium]|nr:glycosyltransferase family 4 protein [Gammaproteobacteria bacterium]
MLVYLCGVFKGPLTGQKQTLFVIKDILDSKFDLVPLDAPSLSIYFPYTWLVYLIKTLSISFFNKRPHVFYLIINRSRISFWIRDLPIYIVASVTNSKLICHLVGSDIELFIKKSNFIEKFLLKKYLSRVNAWVVLGNGMKMQVENVYKNLGIQAKASCYRGEKLNAFELKGFYPLESDNFFDESKINLKIQNFGNDIRIGFMSNLMEEKGIVEFIESMIFLKETLGHDINVWIAGAYIGKQSDRLNNAMHIAKSKDYIKILGLAKAEQKWKSLLQTDIFILPSYYKTEALPLSLVEAMRFGCLCISSSIGEINDLLENERGIIIKKVSTNSITQSVEGILADTSQSKIMIKNSLSYAQEEFSYEEYKIRLLNLMELLAK